jgi:hypothetical protein
LSANSFEDEFEIKPTPDESHVVSCELHDEIRNNILKLLKTNTNFVFMIFIFKLIDTKLIKITIHPLKAIIFKG